MTSKVYFTRKLDSQTVVDMYKKLNVEQKGKLAIKIHSGELNGKYYLKTDYLQPIYDYTKGTYVECNAAYKAFFAPGKRYSTDLHKELLKEHNFGDKRFCLMDENKEKDKKIPIEGGELLKENILGEHYDEFDSLLVVAHVKGHPMAGFGGALKQLSIGFASQTGKCNIHTAAKTTNWEIMLDPGNPATPQNFTRAMAEAASSVHKYYKNKNQGGPVYINVIKDISLYCDCTGSAAPEPEIHDIGILASTDPVAIDQASIDLIKKTKDKGTEKFMKQMEDLCGENIIVQAEKLGAGNRKYELVFEKDDGPVDN